MNTRFLVRKSQKSTQRSQRSLVLQDRSNNQTIVTNLKRRNAIIPLIHEPKIVQTKENKIAVPRPQDETETMNKFKMQNIAQFHSNQSEREYKKPDLSSHYSLHEIELLKDWMIGEFSYFKQSSYATVFQAIELFDSYLCRNRLVPDLRLLAVICIFMSSKLIDNYCIQMSDVMTIITQEQYTIHQLLEMEQRICQLFNFDIWVQTPFEDFDWIFAQLNESDDIYEKGVTYLLILMISDHFRTIPHIEKAIGCVYLALHEHKRDPLSILPIVDHLQLNLNDVHLLSYEIQNYSQYLRVLPTRFMSTFLRY